MHHLSSKYNVILHSILTYIVVITTKPVFTVHNVYKELILLQASHYTKLHPCSMNTSFMYKAKEVGYSSDNTI